MDVLLLGATGRTGRLIASQLLAQGHHVCAIGRSQPDNARIAFTKGDVSQPDTLRPVLDRVDAVISALASSNSAGVCSGAASAVIAAAHGRAVRFVTIGGAAVDAPGDDKGFADKLVGGIMSVFMGKMLADRQQELDLLRSSNLRWTMLRPPRLTTSERTGAWHLTHDRPAGSSISRADLAQAAIFSLTDDTLIGTAPFVAHRKT